MLAVIDNEEECLGGTRAKDERRYLIRFLN